MGVGTTLSGFMFLGTAIAKTLELDIFFLSLGLGFAFSANALYFNIAADLFKNKSGTAMGVMTAFFAFSGVASPSITGWVTQKTGSFNSAIYLLFILSIISTCISFFFQFESRKKAI